MLGIRSKRYEEEGPHHGMLIANTAGAWVLWLVATILMLMGWDILPWGVYAVITASLIGFTVWFVRKEKSSPRPGPSTERSQ